MNEQEIDFSKIRKYKFSFRPWIIFVYGSSLILLIISLVALFFLIVFGIASLWWLIFLAGTYVFLNIVLTPIILLSEFNKHSKQSWLFIIYLLPIAGAILYFIFGSSNYINYKKIRQQRKLRSEQLDMNVAFKKNKKLEMDIKLSKLDMVSQISNRKISNNTSIKLISSSSKFDKIFKAMLSAKTYIYIEYYIFNQGELFYDLLEIVNKKSKEGVEIKILIDDFGSAITPLSKLKLFEKAGAQLRIFNKLAYAPPSGSLNSRLHRKIIIIDGEIGYTGGMNIGDEYIGYSKKYGDWLDAHLEVIGNSIKDLYKSFILDWNNSSKTKLEFDSKKIRETKISNNKNNICIVDDGIDREMDNFEKIFSNILKTATKRIWISTPYNIIPKRIINSMIDSAKKGIDIKIFVPGKYDKLIPYKAGQYYLQKFSDNKIKVYATKNVFLHSKLILWDDDLVMVGTSNLDLRSIYVNYEINLFSDSKKLIDNVENEFLTMKKYSNKYKAKYNSHYPWNWILNLFFWLSRPIF